MQKDELQHLYQEACDLFMLASTSKDVAYELGRKETLEQIADMYGIELDYDDGSDE